MQKRIEDLTVDQLKAHIYDASKAIQAWQNDIKLCEEQLVKLEQLHKKEQEKIAEVKKP